MEHYVVVSKSFSVNDAGDGIMDDVNVLAVKHSEEDARIFINTLRQEYENDDYRVDDDDNQAEDGSTLVMPNEEDPGYYIHIYFEIIKN